MSSPPSVSTTVFDSRNRMISVRLSAEEYEKFRELCFSAGIRSISEMARLAINKFLNQATPEAVNQNALDVRISELEARLHLLSNELRRHKKAAAVASDDDHQTK